MPQLQLNKYKATLAQQKTAASNILQPAGGMMAPIDAI